MAASRNPTSLRKLRTNARTIGNSISIAYDPSETMGNDYTSTLLHEGFHLLISGRGIRITDTQLASATSKADGTLLRNPSGSESVASEFNKQMFGTHGN